MEDIIKYAFLIIKVHLVKSFKSIWMAVIFFFLLSKPNTFYPPYLLSFYDIFSLLNWFKAQTCFNLLFILLKLALGVRAYTFFNLISDIFFLILGVKQNFYLNILLLDLSFKSITFIKWLLFSELKFIWFLGMIADLFSIKFVDSRDFNDYFSSLCSYISWRSGWSKAYYKVILSFSFIARHLDMKSFDMSDIKRLYKTF